MNYNVGLELRSYLSLYKIQMYLVLVLMYYVVELNCKLHLTSAHNM